MAYVGRLFFRRDTGTLLHYYEMQGDIVVSMIEQDLLSFKSLQDYLPEMVEIIELNESDLITRNKVNTASSMKLDIPTRTIIFNFDKPLDKTSKIQEIKTACQNTIISGFDSSAKGEISRHYTLSITDQLNIKELHDKILGGATVVPWHYSGQTICELWTAQEFEQFNSEKEMFVLQTRFYSDGLEEMINRATNIEEVNAINWGVPLSPDIQQLIDNIIAQLPV